MIMSKINDTSNGALEEQTAESEHDPRAIFMQLSQECRISIRRRGQLPPRDSTAEAQWPSPCAPAR
jgi:hypothetical protein